MRASPFNPGSSQQQNTAAGVSYVTPAASLKMSQTTRISPDNSICQITKNHEGSDSIHSQTGGALPPVGSYRSRDSPTGRTVRGDLGPLVGSRIPILIASPGRIQGKIP